MILIDLQAARENRERIALMRLNEKTVELDTRHTRHLCCGIYEFVPANWKKKIKGQEVILPYGLGCDKYKNCFTCRLKDCKIERKNASQVRKVGV